MTDLPYRPVEAFQLGEAVYKTERQALVAAIAAELAATAGPSTADVIYEAGSRLLPLLVRAMAVRADDLSPVSELDRNGFDTTPRRRRWVDGPLSLTNPSMVQMEAELTALKGRMPFKAEDSQRVFNFLYAWSGTGAPARGAKFDAEALVILAADREACETVPGYNLPGRGAPGQ